jgi:hypothetical protein
MSCPHSTTPTETISRIPTEDLICILSEVCDDIDEAGGSPALEIVKGKITAELEKRGVA